MSLFVRRLAAPFAVLLLSTSAPSAEVASVPLADGFECPVGRGGAKQYYKARGFRSNGHLGEDWNGVGGGDSDLGDPVYAAGTGLVVFARDYRLGWGNVVIVRHAYLEGGETKFVDSLYGHLDRIDVREGQQVRRGHQVGTIGSNRGMYDAHLHFEMRKNLQIGMHRNSFARDFSNYWDPTEFIASRQTLVGGRIASIPTDTFAETPPPAYAQAVEEGFRLALPQSAPGKANAAAPKTNSARGPFAVDRYSDLREPHHQ